MPAKQTKRPEPKPAPAPAAAAEAEQAPQKPTRKYGENSLQILLIHCIDRATEKELAFLDQMVKDWQSAPYDLMEIAYMRSANHFGLALHEAHVDRYFFEPLNDIIRILQRDGWLSRFLGTLAHICQNQKTTPTPEDVMRILEQETKQFLLNIETARDFLAHYPDTIGPEIYELTQKRPDLTSPRNS